MNECRIVLFRGTRGESTPACGLDHDPRRGHAVLLKQKRVNIPQLVLVVVEIPVWLAVISQFVFENTLVPLVVENVRKFFVPPPALRCELGPILLLRPPRPRSG